MNRGRINQGVLLLLVGLFFLLRNFGWIDDSFLDVLVANWPVLLIFAGIYLMLSRSALWFVPAVLSVVLFLMFAGMIPGPLSPDEPREVAAFAHTVAPDARSIDLTFESPSAHLKFSKGTDQMVSGNVRYSGKAPETSARQVGERFVVDFRYAQTVRRWSFDQWRTPHWDVTVPSDLPLSLTVHIAAGDLTLDLRGLDPRDVEIHSSAGDIHVIFDESVQTSRLNLDTAVSFVRLTVPEGVGMRVKSEGALLSTNLKGLGFTEDGNWYVSPDYESAASRIEVHFNSAVGKLTVSRDPYV